MAWFAVVRDADGELISVGDVIADDAVLATQGYIKLLLGDVRPNLDSVIWDKLTRLFVARNDPPPPDRILRMMADAQIVALNTNTKNLVQAKLVAYFDDVRLA